MPTDSSMLAQEFVAILQPVQTTYQPPHSHPQAVHHQRQSSDASSVSSLPSSESLHATQQVPHPSDFVAGTTSQFGYIPLILDNPSSTGRQMVHTRSTASFDGRIYGSTPNDPRDHSRTTSLSASTDITSVSDSQDSHDLDSSFKPNHRRNGSLRRHRATSSPYGRDLRWAPSSSSTGSLDYGIVGIGSGNGNGNGGRTAEEEIASLLAQQEQDEDWGSKRSSVASSGAWSGFESTPDPANGSGFMEMKDADMDSVNQHHLFAARYPGAMSRSADVNATLEALAQHVRSAITTNASDRARAAFVQAWLLHTYVSYPDGNVSRQGLYASYHGTCSRHAVKPINSASFGKAVRQAFPNIKTRRLGVRGNSKYHYCGIRPATVEEAELLGHLSNAENKDMALPAIPQQPVLENSSSESGGGGGGHDNKPVFLKKQTSVPSLKSPLLTNESQVELMTPTTSNPALAVSHPTFAFGNPRGAPPRHRRHTTPASNLMINVPAITGMQGEVLAGGEATAVPAQPLANFPSIEDILPNIPVSQLDHDSARAIWKSFTEHCHALLNWAKDYRFDQFELTIRTFWDHFDERQRSVIQHDAMTSLVYRADTVLYDEILEFLHSQTLQPMPSQTFASLRQLADAMENVTIVSLQAFAPAFVGPRIELSARLGHLITRHLGICSLAQALQGVLSNGTALKEMSDSWNAIDFEAVRNQAALVTNCQHELLAAAFDQFRNVLANPGPNPLETFIAFVNSAYESFLAPNESGERAVSPRSLLVRWSFVSMQLMRDLTLRSAPSFGSFQIVSLFFEEWIAFAVLRKVALQVNAVSAGIQTAEQDPGPRDPSYLAITPVDPSGLEKQQQQQQTRTNDASGGNGQSNGNLLSIPYPSMSLQFSPRTSAAFAEIADQAHFGDLVTAAGPLAASFAPEDYPGYRSPANTPSSSTHTGSHGSRPSTSGAAAEGEQQVNQGMGIMDIEGFQAMSFTSTARSPEAPPPPPQQSGSMDES